MKISPRTRVIMARNNPAGIKAGYVEQLGVKLTPPPPRAEDLLLVMLALLSAGKGPAN